MKNVINEFSSKYGLKYEYLVENNHFFSIININDFKKFILLLINEYGCNVLHSDSSNNNEYSKILVIQSFNWKYKIEIFDWKNITIKNINYLFSHIKKEIRSIKLNSIK